MYYPKKCLRCDAVTASIGMYLSRSRPELAAHATCSPQSVATASVVDYHFCSEQHAGIFFLYTRPSRTSTSGSLFQNQHRVMEPYAPYPQVRVLLAGEMSLPAHMATIALLARRSTSLQADVRDVSCEGSIDLDCGTTEQHLAYRSPCDMKTIGSIPVTRPHFGVTSEHHM